MNTNVQARPLFICINTSDHMIKCCPPQICMAHVIITASLLMLHFAENCKWQQSSGQNSKLMTNESGHEVSKWKLKV